MEGVALRVRMTLRLSQKAYLFLTYRFFKWTKTNLTDASTNNGVHMHGIILANRWGRLTDPLDVHFRDKRATYVAGKIRSINVVKIKDRPQYTTEYAGKGLKRTCFNTDHVLILPRTLSELAGTCKIYRAKFESSGDCDLSRSGSVNRPRLPDETC